MELIPGDIINGLRRGTHPVSKVYKFIPAYGNVAATVRVFASKKEAASIGNSGTTLTTIEELRSFLATSMEVSSKELASIFNAIGGKPPVTKFESKEVGARRVSQLLETKEPETLPWGGANQENSMATQDAVKDKAAKAAEKEAAKAKAAAEKEAAKAKAAAEKEAAKAAKAKAAADKKAEREAAKAAKGDGRSGRTAGLAGKVLKAKVTDNPRRPGSHGFRSLQIIIDAGANGIPFEDYIKKGGRNVDAKWDIDHGSAVAVEPKS
jgi:hypothetical protein